MDEKKVLLKFLFKELPSQIQSMLPDYQSVASIVIQHSPEAIAYKLVSTIGCKVGFKFAIMALIVIFL
jgi:hypothetical protein